MGENSVAYQAGDCVRVTNFSSPAYDVENGDTARLLNRGGYGTAWWWVCIDRTRQCRSIPENRLSPVHPSEVGQRVRVIDHRGARRALLGKPGVMIPGSANSVCINLDCGESLYDWPRECFIVISEPDTPPEPVEATEQPAEQGEDVRCPYCGGEMEMFGSASTFYLWCQKSECRSMGPNGATAEEALSAARQRHQEEVGDGLQRVLDVVWPLFSPHGPVTGSLDWNMAWQHAEAVIKELRDGTERHQEGPFRWGQEVVNAGDVGYLFGCINPLDTTLAMCVNEDGHASNQLLSDLRPVPAPREYTLADLRELLAEGTQVWATSDQWGDWVRRATEALEATGRPFAEAAKEDEE